MYKTRNLPNTRIEVADALRGIAVIGIILRWDAVIAGIRHGFHFYSGK